MIDTDQDADVLPVLTGAVYRYITAGRDGFVKDGDSVHMPLLVTSWGAQDVFVDVSSTGVAFQPGIHFEIIVDQHWKPPEPFGGHTAKGVAPKSYPSQSN